MSETQARTDSRQFKRKIKVLIAEDDDDHAEILSFGLNRTAMCESVTRVSDGEQLLAYLESNGPGSEGFPDIVLLDLKMPRKSGLEVLKIIKEDPALLTLPVLVLSTSNAPHDRELAYQAHANSYLVKPTEFGTYRDLVNDLMRYWSQWNVSPPPPEVPEGDSKGNVA